MISKDLHMHTAYCDGACTPEEMVQSAVKKGLNTVGISGHSYTFFDTSYCMQKADIPRYIVELRYLRAKYFDRIHVLCGVEQDYYSTYPIDDFDYVIGSVHYLKVNDDTYIPVDESPAILKKAAETYFNGDIYALCEQYFETVADVADKTDCDIIGHFDLISKFVEDNAYSVPGSIPREVPRSAAYSVPQSQKPLFDVNHPRYVAAWQYAVDELLLFDIPFEINTGAMSRGYRTSPYPSADMIAYIKDRGGRFILSSDAHSANGIAYKFDKYEAFIKPSP